MGMEKNLQPISLIRWVYLSSGATAITSNPFAINAFIRPERKLTIFHDELREITILCKSHPQPNPYKRFVWNPIPCIEAEQNPGSEN